MGMGQCAWPCPSYTWEVYHTVSHTCDKSMHMGGSWKHHAYTCRCHPLLHGQQHVAYIEHGHEKMVMHTSLYPQMPIQCTWSWACLNVCTWPFMGMHRRQCVAGLASESAPPARGERGRQWARIPAPNGIKPAQNTT